MWAGLKHVLLDPNPRPLLLQWFETFDRMKTSTPVNELTQETNKTYEIRDEDSSEQGTGTLGDP